MENQLEAMGVAIEKNNFLKNICEAYHDFFTEEERKKEKNIKRKMDFLALQVYGDRLFLIIEDVEKFQAYWGVNGEGKLSRGYNGIILMYFYNHHNHVNFYLDDEKCDKKLESGCEETIDLVGENLKGYKLIRLFKQETPWNAYGKMLIELTEKENQLKGSKFAVDLTNIVFQEIEKRVDKRIEELISNFPLENV